MPLVLKCQAQQETFPPPLKPSPAGGRWRVAPDEEQRPLALHATDRISSHKKGLLHETLCSSPLGSVSAADAHMAAEAFFDLCLASGAALACAVQLAHQVILVLALAGGRLGIFRLPGALAGLGNVRVDAL